MGFSPPSTHASGGTITQATVIDTSASQTADALTVHSGDPTNVGVDLLTDTSLGKLVVTGRNTYGAVRVVNDFDASSGEIGSNYLQVVADGATIARTDAGGVNRVALGTFGLLVAVHAAPADGDISAGECALWFDQTNGVGNTKLMAKGKSADGTVKTAAILLA